MPNLHRVLRAAGFLILACFVGTSARAADSPTIKEIVAGIQRRESHSRIADLRLRYQVQISRTDFYFQMRELWVKSAQESGRALVPPPEPREQSNIYEIIEHAPRWAWSRFAADGALLELRTFDGTLAREYRPDAPVMNPGSISRPSSTPISLPLVRPERFVDAGGASLVEWLTVPDVQVQIQQTRQVDGEQLVDLELLKTYPLHNRNQAKIRATINVSRDFWPVYLRYEHVQREPPGTGFVNEVIATGWIEAGPLVYPEHIEERSFRSLHLPLAQSTPDGDAPQPKLSEIKRLDIQKIAVNRGIPDTEFAPQFPLGAVYLDQRDRKFYQVDPAAKSVAYVPQPRGLRGAVFVYHLFWITALSTYCLIRSRSRKPRYSPVSM